MTDIDKTTREELISVADRLRRYSMPILKEAADCIADLERQLSEARDRALDAVKTEVERAEVKQIAGVLTYSQRNAVIDAMGRVSDALRTQPAPDPRYTNCVQCGRVVDTLPTEDGGDKFGDRLDGDQWVCSSECWEAASPLPAPDPVSDKDLRERVEQVIDRLRFDTSSTPADIADAALREMRTAQPPAFEPAPDDPMVPHETDGKGREAGCVSCGGPLLLPSDTVCETCFRKALSEINGEGR